MKFDKCVKNKKKMQSNGYIFKIHVQQKDIIRVWMASLQISLQRNVQKKKSFEHMQKCVWRCLVYIKMMFKFFFNEKERVIQSWSNPMIH